MPAATRREKHVRKRKTAVPAGARQPPGGLIRAVAKVIDSGHTFTAAKGIPYYFINGEVVGPLEHAGTRFMKMWFLKAVGNKTVQDKWDEMKDDLQLLGLEVKGVSEKHLPALLANLKNDDICFEFNTWQPAPDKKNPNPNTFVFIQGVCDPPTNNEDELSDEQAELGTQSFPPAEMAAPQRAWEPKPKNMYLFKSNPLAKKEGFVVVKVNKSKQTVKLKRLRDDRLFSNIPWKALEAGK